MKTNAIIRIICFSLSLVILSGVLWVGLDYTPSIQDHLLDGDQQRESSFSPAANVSPEPDMTDSLSTDPTVLTDQVITLGVEHVRDIDIEWVAGNITILPDPNATDIRFYESGAEQEADRMVWELEEQSLSIEYTKDYDEFPGISFSSGFTKDLMIQVPADWICSSLEIDAAAANVDISDLTIQELDFDGASGRCTLNNCSITTLDLDAASGDVVFSGSLEILDFDGASANCTLKLVNCPQRIDMDGASGTLDITLPDDCGFTAKMGTLSGKFDCEFATTNHNGSHIFGDGRCQIHVDAMSGKLCIRKSGQNCHRHNEHCISNPESCPGSHHHGK